MPYINDITASLSTKAETVEAIGVTPGQNQEGLATGAQIVVPLTNLRNVRHMAKNVFTARRRDILASFVIPSIVASLLDQI